MNFVCLQQTYTKCFEALPAEFNSALGLIAGDLLFFNVKQNIIRKQLLKAVKINPYKNLAKTYQYKPYLRSAGKAEKIAIDN